MTVKATLVTIQVLTVITCNPCHRKITKSNHIKYLSSKSEHNSSNLALVRVVSICLGPSAVAVMNGKLERQNYQYDNQPGQGMVML